MNSADKRLAASDGNSSGGSYGPNRGGRERQRGRSGGSEGKSKNWFLRHKVFTIVALSIFIVLMVTCTVLANMITNHSADVLTNRTTQPTADTTTADNSTTASTSTAGVATSAAVSQTAADDQPPDYTFPKDIVNILVLGTDASAARIKAGMNARTDCVMLVSINTTTKKVSMISIPRDTYVKIYNANNKLAGKNRINAAFAYGGGLKKNGIPYAVNTISRFLGGVPIDHYVLFDMDFVKALIDACGGVKVNVEIDATINGVHYTPGEMKLTGAAALAYARDRHNTKGGDFGRVDHQQDVMVALLKELQDKGNIVKKIPELYSAFTANVTTDPDLGALQIAALAWIAKDLNISNVTQYTLQGQSLMINGASIVIADQSDKQKILQDVFGINYQIRADETYSHLKGEVTKLLNAGKGIVSTAESLLSNNTQYYTADEAQDLRNAIAAWKKASGKNDSDGMVDAQQDVQTQYTILKGLIDDRKAGPTDSPEPSDTPSDNPTDNPTENPTDNPTEAPTDEPTIAPTATPSPTKAAATATPAPDTTDSEQQEP